MGPDQIYSGVGSALPSTHRPARHTQTSQGSPGRSPTTSSETGRSITEVPLGRRCPLWVISGHFSAQSSFPLSPESGHQGAANDAEQTDKLASPSLPPRDQRQDIESAKTGVLEGSPMADYR